MSRQKVSIGSDSGRVSKSLLLSTLILAMIMFWAMSRIHYPKTPLKIDLQTEPTLLTK